MAHSEDLGGHGAPRLRADMLRYSLRDMVCGMTLIIFGLASVCWTFAKKGPVEPHARFLQELVAWFAGCTSIGAGAFLPFKKTWLVIAFGLIVAVALWAVAA
jgi:hypothetical protein